MFSRILLDNVNLGSSSGPNSFGRQLTTALKRKGLTVVNSIDMMSTVRGRNTVVDIPDVQLSFIESRIVIRGVPLIQRLDGIYYNSDPKFGDWWIQNQNIKSTYDRANGVVFQSPFSRRLVESFFGEKDDVDVAVIGNGVDLDEIEHVPCFDDKMLDRFDKVWMSASNWRPHKRLSENIRYFFEHASPHDVMIIAGTHTGPYVSDPRIMYVGDVNRTTLLSLYKRADNFIHLAYHDNCPNVVVDARAAGCDIICASCSGTKYIAGPDATVILEDDWEPQPIELYNPPKLDFTKTSRCGIESSIDINDVVDSYVNFIDDVISRSDHN